MTLPVFSLRPAEPAMPGWMSAVFSVAAAADQQPVISNGPLVNEHV